MTDTVQHPYIECSEPELFNRESHCREHCGLAPDDPIHAEQEELNVVGVPI